MKMLFLVTDSEYEPHCMNTLKDKGVTGYTVIPEVLGFGRTGAKMGDRVHPGASVIVVSVVPDEAVEELLGCLRQCMAENKLSESTHAWVLPVEGVLQGSPKI
ncbi:MAG: PG0541 family transporter-associated protein [Acidobacteriota bacterium]